MCVCVCACVCVPTFVSVSSGDLYVLEHQDDGHHDHAGQQQHSKHCSIQEEYLFFRLGLVLSGGGRGLNGSVCGRGLNGGGRFHISDGNGENTAPVVQRKLREEGMSQVTSHPHPHTHTHQHITSTHITPTHTLPHTHSLSGVG